MALIVLEKFKFIANSFLKFWFIKAFKKEILTINLKEELISVRDINISFNIDNIVKNRLINGYDDIELTLKNENLIKQYEKNKNKFFDWKYIEWVIKMEKF